MKKVAIKEYIFKKYNGIVELWKIEKVRELQEKDLEKMILLEEILELFGYLIHNGCHSTEIVRKNVIIYSYKF